MSQIFDKLKAQLEQQEWPAVYLFKFICPNKPEELALVSALFGEEADMTFHESKKGTYVSVSCKELMLDVNSIIDRYEKAAKIKGVISL